MFPPSKVNVRRAILGYALAFAVLLVLKLLKPGLYSWWVATCLVWVPWLLVSGALLLMFLKLVFTPEEKLQQP